MNWDFIESEEFAEILYMYRTASMSQDVSKYLNHIKKYIRLNMELTEVNRELQAKLVLAETELPPQSENEALLDHMMAEALPTNHPAMLEYVRQRMELKRLRVQASAPPVAIPFIDTEVKENK